MGREVRAHLGCLRLALKLVHVLGVHVVRGLGARLVHHLGELAGVVQQRARPQHVGVERLVSLIALEQRALVALEQGLLADVGVGVVDERARLHVAGGVDVHVATGAGNAATRVLAVVPEVREEDGHVVAPVLADLVVHAGALLGGGEKLHGSAQANGHVREDPREEDALIDEELDVLVARDGVVVCAGVAH